MSLDVTGASLELDHEDVEIHIESTLYDENSLSLVEEYVIKQMKENAPYDFYSNLYLMKMYSLHPSKAKKEIIIQLLLKAMINLPSSDFTALVYLIPIPYQSKYTEIETILTLGQALEDCEFDVFWTEFYENERLFSNFSNLTLEVQRYICLMISTVYQNLSVDLLYNLLQIQSSTKNLKSMSKLGNRGKEEKMDENKESENKEKEEIDENDDDSEIQALEKCLLSLNLEWEIRDKIVYLPKTDENSAEVKRKTQFVSTDQMNNILGTLF